MPPRRVACLCFGKPVAQASPVFGEQVVYRNSVRVFRGQMGPGRFQGRLAWVKSKEEDRCAPSQCLGLGSTRNLDPALGTRRGWRNLEWPKTGLCVRPDECFYFCRK